MHNIHPAYVKQTTRQLARNKTKIFLLVYCISEMLEMFTETYRLTKELFSQRGSPEKYQHPLQHAVTAPPQQYLQLWVSLPQPAKMELCHQMHGEISGCPFCLGRAFSFGSLHLQWAETEPGNTWAKSVLCVFHWEPPHLLLPIMIQKYCQLPHCNVTSMQVLSTCMLTWHF